MTVSAVLLLLVVALHLVESRHHHHLATARGELQPDATPSTVNAPCKGDTYRFDAPCQTQIQLRMPLPACGAIAALDEKTRNLANAPSHSTFAVLGDFGQPSAGCEAQVRTLVQQIEHQFGKLDFISTTGDNAYESGSCDEHARAVGDLYGDFLPASSRAPTCVDPAASADDLPTDASTANAHDLTMLEVADSPPPDARFFPVIGNHDWKTFRNSGDQLPFLQARPALIWFPQLLGLQYFSYLRNLPPSIGRGAFYTVSPVQDVQLFVLNRSALLTFIPLI